ncbi:MAG: SDR family NAD(P)-dependent oxidoreductase [Candidatus Heimdallarchaeota archaeon]|nr:SDR family NAD(P)-dependent oxidoreductase [Candidatus Heimdallarchaeota archaeon]
MKDKICIVTGANSGIGKETAKQLVELGAHIVMIVRNEEKGSVVLTEIKKEIRNASLDLMVCDFSSQESIRTFTQTFKEKYNQLDVLVNNHGALFGKRQLTPDGLESTFAVNHLGYFLLTKLLLDILKSSAHSRIINVSSGAYAAVRSWPLKDYNYEKRRYSSFKAYSESKLYNIMFTYYLADLLSETNVTVNTYTPGFTRTNFGKNTLLMRFFSVLLAPFANSPAKAAKTAIYLASSPEVENITGKYFVKCKQKETNPLSNNKEYQKELWELSEQLTTR